MCVCRCVYGKEVRCESSVYLCTDARVTRLSAAPLDPQTRKHRRATWARAIVEGKRARVLWGFRGLASSFVPWLLHHGHLAARTHGSSSTTGTNAFAWYLYVSVYLSFVMEGFGAFFYALHEAERGCNLQTPFRRAMKECFWLAYNCWLQPLGTLVNVVVYAALGEHKRKIVLREVWSSLLVNKRGNWRDALAHLCGRQRPVAPSAEESRALLDEWLATWRRMRVAAGLGTNNLDIVGPRPKTRPRRPSDVGDAAGDDTGDAAGGGRPQRPQVFKGSVFPTKHEWLLMRDNFHEHIPLLSHEHGLGAEKFLRWYATNSGEVRALLAEPFHFPSSHS